MLLNKRQVLMFLALLLAIRMFGQDCNCESSFQWMKEVFEKNDAGFQYVIDKKGTSEYEKHNAAFLEKVKSAKNNNECAEYLNNWLFFFRKGHIGIEVLKNDTVANSQEEINTFPDWERVDIDTLEFKKYLDEKKEIDLEGIWRSETYTVGIKKVENQFIGFIIDSQAKEWETGQIKFRIYSDSAIYYMRDHSVQRIKQAKLVSPNGFYFDGSLDYVRIYPKYEDKFVETFVNKQFYLKQLNAQTLYLQIPTFPYEANALDSVILTNKEKILSTKNLIIDLRFNGGGSDNAWYNLLPIIYTNPIRQKSCYILSSELNNQQARKYRSNDFYEKLNNNLGKFVPLFSEKYFTNRFDKVYKNPKNVAVIVNEYCASSTEQFLLAARQSKKVKIFGKVTAGELDFSNLNRVVSPCNDFKLYYATSKDVDIESYPIDGIGIQPDFYLDDEIPEYQWINYVNDILNNH